MLAFGSCAECVAYRVYTTDGGDCRADGDQIALMTPSATDDLAVFESHRALLVAHAYRMLGELARAEDMVQEAWLRWSGRRVQVETPRAYLVTLVTRLCLNELGSARTRREESRSDRLPEPIDLDEGGDTLLVLRRPPDVGGIAIERISQAEHLLLATLAAGCTLDEAANRCAGMAPEFDLAAALQRHVAGNTIVAFRAPVVPTSESAI